MLVVRATSAVGVVAVLLAAACSSDSSSSSTPADDTFAFGALKPETGRADHESGCFQRLRLTPAGATIVCSA